MAGHVIVHEGARAGSFEVVPEGARLCDRLEALCDRRIPAIAYRALRPGSTAHDPDDQTGASWKNENADGRRKWCWWAEDEEPT